MVCSPSAVGRMLIIARSEKGNEEVTYLLRSGVFELDSVVDAPRANESFAQAIDVVGGEEQQATLLSSNAIKRIQQP